jgi:two-component system cell cycle response regulator
VTSEGAVLVVDDSLVVRSVVRGWLEEHGYEVTEVEDGTAAIEACLTHPPDVVLLDIEMPGLNGHEVLARLKSLPVVQDIPVVFLTNHASMDEVLRGLGGGAHDYLRKPFEPAELVARVGAAARVKKLQDLLRKRNGELDAISRTDALTGLFNRRHLEEQLRACANASRRHGHPMGVVLIDVDHFKSVNDTYGHPAGDSVLRELARRITAQLRAGDVAGRWGGEEFLVIVPHTDLDGAVHAGERIRAVVASEPFDIGGTTATVTVSGGCSARVGPSVEDLVRAADAGLYEAKESGRNRMVAA